LRDGAAAQYGSDAIAGVINIELKDSVDELNSCGSMLGEKMMPPCHWLPQAFGVGLVLWGGLLLVTTI